MLIEFSVENFRSFKDKVTFSMEKGIGDENDINIFKFDNIELLKTSALYGANASGKTNLVRAFTTAILMIRQSNMIPVGGKWREIVPFMLDEDSRNKPTKFEFVFVANNTKYKYSFSTDGSKIYDESLLAYYSQKPSSIFKRTNVNDYEFPINDESKLKQIVSKNTENKLFLATATTWNYEKTKDPYLWFMSSIDTYDNFSDILDNDLKSLSEPNNELKEFTLKLLREADIVIKDIKVDYEEREMDLNLANMIIPPIARTAEIPKIKNFNIEVEHEVIDGKGKNHVYSINFNDESSGTRILFALAPLLKRAFESTKVIIVDELENSLHPTLVEYIINIFNNPRINKTNSQLIFTTHAVNLLDLDLFRRDQIWFAEKDGDTGVTDIYPLDDFSVRKTENIEKGYLNGRYGAIPFIKEGESLWDE